MTKGEQKTDLTYDVIIIGGGPAGTACAIYLRKSGVKKVLVLESGEYDKFRIGESIPPESRIHFQQMGIWNAFLKENHDPCYGSVSFWGNDKRGYNDTILSPYGSGWHLDRRRFNAFMAREALNAGAAVLTNVRYKSTTRLPEGSFKLNCSDKAGKTREFEARIVVDASGSRSVFATDQGCQKIRTAPLVCLGARFRSNDDSIAVSRLTHLEAVEYGWWYVARLPDESILVTLYSDKTTIRHYDLSQKDKWYTRLMTTVNTHKLMKNMLPIDSSPRGFYAPSFRLDKVIGGNWLAIGDAASAYDPITSQGIIKSLSNAHSASQLIAQKLENPDLNFKSYQQEITQNFNAYLTMRKQHYLQESRWPHASFWKKFHESETHSLFINKD